MLEYTIVRFIALNGKPTSQIFDEDEHEALAVLKEVLVMADMDYEEELLKPH